MVHLTDLESVLLSVRIRPRGPHLRNAVHIETTFSLGDKCYVVLNDMKTEAVVRTIHVDIESKPDVYEHGCLTKKASTTQDVIYGLASEVNKIVFLGVFSEKEMLKE